MEVIGYDDNTHKQTLDHSSEAVCYILLLNFFFFCVWGRGVYVYIFSIIQTLNRDGQQFRQYQ